MPIKGLTDRGMMFPEIGQIRKGDKKDDTKNAPGRDLPYFRVEFDEKEAEAASKFSQVYGDKPTDIAIVLPFNEVEKCWDAWLEAYRKGRMVARADGERYLYKVNDAGEVEVLNGEPLMLYSPSDVLGTWKDGKGKVNEIKCKPVGRLKVVIPELQRLAFLTLHTTSYHDVKNIQAQLEAIAAINGGRLAGIPLVLRRRPKKISTPKPDGTSARYTKYMISIEADPEFVKRMLVELKTAALPGNGLALLPEPEHKQHPVAELTEADYQEAEFDDDVEDGEFEEEPEAEPVKIWVDDPLVHVDDMKLEMAIKTKDRSGKLFKDYEDAELVKAIEGIKKYVKTKVADNGDKLSAETITDLQYKLAAIRAISLDRENKAVQPQLI